MWTLEIRVINMRVSQEFPHTCLLIAVFRAYLLAVNQSADCCLKYQAKKQKSYNVQLSEPMTASRTNVIL